MMKIGELAKATGTQAETIRYYEREGLLPHSNRTEKNYRVYNEKHVERLLFIRRCRTLDMTLNEIRSLLRFNDVEEENCDEVNALLDEHIKHVASRIQELKKLETQLKDLRKYCRCREAFMKSGHIVSEKNSCLCKEGSRQCGILTELLNTKQSDISELDSHNHIPTSHSCCS